MDQLTAARIDEHDAGFHPADGGAVDHVAGFVGQRAVQRDDVGAAVKFVQRHVFYLRPYGIFRVGVDVVRENLHAESLEDADQFAGDLSGADDTRRLAVHVESQQAVQREVAVARAPIGAVDLTVERQHQHHGVFRHGMRRIGGNAHDGNAVFRRGFQVHVVESRAAQGDQLHVHRRQRAYRGGIGRIVHEDTDRIGPLRQRSVVAVQVAAMVIEFESVTLVGAVERLPVIGLRAEEGYFHNARFYLFLTYIERYTPGRYYAIVTSGSRYTS